MMQVTKLTYAENQSEDSLVLLSLQLSKINLFYNSNATTQYPNLQQF